MNPRDVTIAIVEGELPALRGYAKRHSWTVDWQEQPLSVTLVGPHPADGKPVRIHGDLTGYRAVPPAWSLLHSDLEDVSSPRIPKRGTMLNGQSTIYHDNGVICAPFNRLAYQEHKGPHGDWGGPANWLQVRGHVIAHTLGAMLAQFVVHLSYSSGWHK